MAATVSLTFVAASAAMAANSGLLGSRPDNVGKLTPATTPATPAPAPRITVVFDQAPPATAAVSTPPGSASVEAAPIAAATEVTEASTGGTPAPGPAAHSSEQEGGERDD